ncbi:MAG: AAA family ATPase [Deltaproteobacteria bacterium]|nr:AAA family ATPase [Deltaproteobacteria bacterium]
MSRTRKPGLRRFATGVAPLDQLLGGGLPAYSVVILAGEPGTGKTILSQQMLFANAAQGRKGMYFTTVSESPIKVARYQSEFSFFDPDKFGESVVYTDLGEIIRRHQLGNAVEMIAESLRQHQPALVVIDSFRAIHDLSPSPKEMRTFSYDLAVELSAIQTTTILIGEYTTDEIGTAPEFAVADGIIWMTLHRTDPGGSRSLQILKMRGAAPPITPFSFDISRDGLTIHALIAKPGSDELPPTGQREPAQTGVSGLDELLRGGIPSGAPVLISGEAGTGKSTLGMQFLHHGAAALGEVGLYFSYEEQPPQLIANARKFGWDLVPLIQQSLVQIHHTPLSHVNLDAENLRVQDLLAKTGAKRVFIDSLTMMGHAILKPEALRSHVFSLTRVLRASGATALVTTDPPAGSGLISRFGVEESILDGVILLRNVKVARDRKRQIEVYKMRGVAHATGEHLMRITSKGMQVFPRCEEVGL